MLMTHLMTAFREGNHFCIGYVAEWRKNYRHNLKRFMGPAIKIRGEFLVVNERTSECTYVRTCVGVCMYVFMHICICMFM
jgi:hypothetical protein